MFSNTTTTILLLSFLLYQPQYNMTWLVCFDQKWTLIIFCRRAQEFYFLLLFVRDNCAYAKANNFLIWSHCCKQKKDWQQSIQTYVYQLDSSSLIVNHVFFSHIDFLSSYSTGLIIKKINNCKLLLVITSNS